MLKLKCFREREDKKSQHHFTKNPTYPDKYKEEGKKEKRKKKKGK